MHTTALETTKACVYVSHGSVSKSVNSLVQIIIMHGTSSPVNDDQPSESEELTKPTWRSSLDRRSLLAGYPSPRRTTEREI